MLFFFTTLNLYDFELQSELEGMRKEVVVYFLSYYSIFCTEILRKTTVSTSLVKTVRKGLENYAFIQVPGPGSVKNMRSYLFYIIQQNSAAFVYKKCTNERI